MEWGDFLSQNDLLHQAFHRGCVERLTNHGEFSWYGKQPQFYKQGLPTTGLARLHHVDQIAAIGNGEPLESKNRMHRDTVGWRSIRRQTRLVHDCRKRAVYVLLWTSFIDRCIRYIISTEGIVVHWHSEYVAIVSTRTVTNLIDNDNTVFNMNTLSQYDTSSESNLCRVPRQVTIRAHTHAAILIIAMFLGS